MKTLRFAFNFLSVNLTDSKLTNGILNVERNIESSASVWPPYEPSEVITNVGNKAKMKRSKVPSYNLSNYIEAPVETLNILNGEMSTVEQSVSNRVFRNERDLKLHNYVCANKIGFVKVICILIRMRCP